MLEERRKRSFHDECNDIIGLDDLSRILDSNAGSALAVSRVDYRNSASFTTLSDGIQIESGGAFIFSRLI